MKDMWLVQSGHFINNDKEKKSFDDYIWLDYMGAAEFEIENVYINGKYESKNPLCLSLKRIIKDRENYQWVKMLKRKDGLGNQMYIYCKSEDIEEAKVAVRGLINGKETKRPCGLWGYIRLSGEKIEEKGDRIKNFWWDIKNDIFIVFGEDKVELINEALDKNYEKWKDELFPTPKKISFIDKIKAIFCKKEEALVR